LKLIFYCDNCFDGNTRVKLTEYGSMRFTWSSYLVLVKTTHQNSSKKTIKENTCICK